MSNNPENTHVGAAGVPPVPNSNKNPQRDVAAGPVPADQPDKAQACIIRPDDKCYENILDCAEMGIHEFSSKMAKDLDEVRGQMQSIKSYIQHLEHQLTVAQNQNNLSLTTLRAERDALKEKVAKLEEELRDHEKTL